MELSVYLGGIALLCLMWVAYAFGKASGRQGRYPYENALIDAYNEVEEIALENGARPSEVESAFIGVADEQDDDVMMLMLRSWERPDYSTPEDGLD